MAVRLLLAALLGVPLAGFLAQDPTLTITAAAPRGELAQLDDAHEIRLTFSEPMVAVGESETTVPPWVRIGPAVALVASWSGTRTLLLTPDPGTPLPYGTTYRVRVAADARSLAGRALGRPFELTFTTPTARLIGADWYREAGRIDRPAFIRLQFNQPMDAARVLRHVRVQLEPHEPAVLTLSADERREWAREDAANLARYDERVAVARTVAGLRTRIGVEIADEWDRERFPEDPGTVVFRTTAPPEVGSWLRVQLDDQLTGLEGDVPHPAQSAVLQLEPAFFPQRPRCVRDCDPSNIWEMSLGFTRGVHIEELRARVSVADVVDGREQPVTPGEAPRKTYRPREGHMAISVDRLGYPPPGPAATRVFALDAGTTSADGQVLGFRWRQPITTGHAPPYAFIDGTVWESGGGTAVPLLTRNTHAVRERLVALQPSEVVPRLIAVAQGRGVPPLPPVEPRVRRLTSSPNQNEAHALDLSGLLHPGGTGLVWAGIEPVAFLADVEPDTRVMRVSAPLLQVTNLALSVKDSPIGTLAWVTTLDTAQPVVGARVQLRDAANEVVWTGTTNADGIARAPALPLRNPQRVWDLAYVVTAEKDGDVAWVASNWTTNARGGGYHFLGARPVLRGSVFTDRGAYALGDDIRVKAVLRHDGPDGLAPMPPGTNVELVVRDGRGQEAARASLTVSEWSSVEWQWHVPATGGLGHYRVQISEPDDRRGGGAFASFLVAAFRRPDFSVEVDLGAPVAIHGAELKGRIDARFLFGAAMGERPVRWTIRRTPVQQVPPAITTQFPADRHAFGYPWRYEPGDAWQYDVATRTDTLAADGSLELTQATGMDTDHAISYQLEASVEGVGGQHIANRAATVLHPASFYVGIARPPFLVDASKPLAAEFLAANLDGTRRAGVPVTVTLVREEWRPDRTEVPFGEWTLTTTSGQVPLAIPLTDGGSYILRAVAQDEAGRSTRTDVRFYAYGVGRGAWRVEGNAVDVVPERQTWEPGEQARLLVQTPWERATALVTLERDGISRYERVEITAARNTITVPIAEADIPNVYVSVLLLKGRTEADTPPHEDFGRPDYRIGYAELRVDDASKRLAVEVSADRAEYRPRDEVQVGVSVRDARGHPARGEVTLWAMDEGLLALTNYTLPDVARELYGHKALQVQTVETRTRLIARRAMIADPALPNAAPGAALGIVGGVAGGVPAPPPPAALAETVTVDNLSARAMAQGAADQDAGPPLRADFRPLAFWVGSLVTGPDGRARTTVRLPDSLTTYRIMAVAGDLASQFGVGDSSIRTSLPLTLLPALPRFLTSGDRASFGATVTNNSTAAGTVRVEVAASDESPLTFESGTSRSIALGPGESALVRFDARAGATGQARVRISARLGAHADAFELPFPIIAPAPLVTVAAYGDTTGRAVETLTVPPDVSGTAGGLTVTLASTALAGLGESKRFLDDYPYDCAEPLASRALAQLLAADLGEAFGTGGDISPAALREEAAATLASLSRFRCGDGGYALFASPDCRSSPYLTAYILHVQRIAESLRVPADRQSRELTLSFLERALRERPLAVQAWPAWAATQAFMVKVMTEAGRQPREAIAELYAAVDRVPMFALSYLADALRASGDTGPRYADVIRRLTNRLRVDADRAFVEELDEASLLWLWHTNVRATGVVLEGLVRRGDRSELIAPLARWLAAERTRGRWLTTQDHAVALSGMVAYYRAMEPEIPQMRVATRLGSRTLATTAFDGRSAVTEQVEVPMTSLAPGSSAELSVERTGTGRAYYTARLQYQPIGVPEPETRGLRLTRSYVRVTPEALGEGVPSTEFTRGDIVRVTVSIWIPHEGRFLAFTDPLPAGLEPIDGALNTTARDLGRESTRQSSDRSWLDRWRRGGFDHVEKHDDRVVAYATRLAPGRHEFSYLARAMTSGSFATAGTWGEAMYAPEITGRAPAATVVVREGR
jgi:alpha-2-macroglobulin